MEPAVIIPKGVSDSIAASLLHATSPAMHLGRSFKDDLKAYRAGIIKTKRDLYFGHARAFNPISAEVISPADPTDLAKDPKTGRYLRGVLKQVSYSHNVATNSGRDWRALALGGDIAADAANVVVTAVAATNVTVSGQTVNAFVGHMLVLGGAFAIVTSNTATTINFDRWITAGTFATPANPATGTAVILPGQGPAIWIAPTTTNITPAATDTTLTGEATQTGMARQPATFAHSAGTGTYTYTITMTLGQTGPFTYYGAGMFTGPISGVMPFENTYTNAVLQLNDQLALTWTITL